MKKIATNLLSFMFVFMFVFLTGNVNFATAQSWGDASMVDYNNSVTSADPTNSIVSTGCTGTGCGASTGWYDASIGDYNNSITSSNPTNSIVSTGCTGDCTSAQTGFGTYIPAQTTTYISPVTETTYTPTVQYTPSVSYTAPSYSTSWTGYDATNVGYVNTSYVTPSYGNTSYTSPSYGYTNTGSYVAPIIQQNPTLSCPAGSSAVNGVCVVNQVSCPAGSYPVNGACIVNQASCPTGSTPINGTCQITQTQCPAGTYPSNGACIHQVLTQSCWDGSVIPTTSVCPSQYKVCSSGSTVLVTQSCPIYVTPAPITPPSVVKFNNVVTSIATDITSTSGRCRGIGLIANNAQSVGWFEYGETANLGRTTATANIGSANTAPFSNVLANLKPQTTYFCRAVMQNQYGLVKGEVVSFRTKAKSSVITVKPVARTTTKRAVKTNQIVCSDGSVVSIASQSAATLMNAGKKLVTLDIEKTYGIFSPNSLVTYKVSFKNISDTNLSNGTIQITLPQGIIFASSTVGNFDPSTRILTVEKSQINGFENGVFTFTAFIPKEAMIGSTIALTAYMTYSLPGTKVADEVTAYVASTVVPEMGTQSTSTTSNERGFMPNSLIEWVALIAILIIIFVLVRSMYLSYKNKGDTHGHAPAHH